MKSINALNRRLDNLEKRLPQPDIEFEVYWGNEEIPDDGREVIVIDIVAANRTIDEEDRDEKPKLA